MGNCRKIHVIHNDMKVISIASSTRSVLLHWHEYICLMYDILTDWCHLLQSKCVHVCIRLHLSDIRLGYHKIRLKLNVEK